MQNRQQVLRANCPNIYTVVKVLEKDTSMSSALESFIKEIIINVKLVHCKMCVWIKLVIPDTNFQPVKTFKLLAQGWPALEATYCLIVVVSHFLSLISVVRGLSGSGRGLSRHGLSRLGLYGLGFSVRPKFGISYSIGRKYWPILVSVSDLNQNSGFGCSAPLIKIG